MKPFYMQLPEWEIRISWTFIRIGSELIEYSYRIKPEDVRAYAAARLEAEPASDVCLSLLNADTDAEVLHIVRDLSEQECLSGSVSLETENRKWIAYALYQFLCDLPREPSFDDLFAFGDLWCYLGFPKHYPWDPRTAEYVKVNDVPAMIEIHRTWLETELTELKQSL